MSWPGSRTRTGKFRPPESHSAVVTYSATGIDVNGVKHEEPAWLAMIGIQDAVRVHLALDHARRVTNVRLESCRKVI
jgi:hypothetical protein